MRVFSNWRTVRPGGESVLAIGSFDGLHAGHMVLLKKVLAVARRKGLRAGVVTFHPHPATVLAPRMAPPLLMTPEQKLRQLRHMKFDWVLMQRFDRRFASMSGSSFALKVLKKACMANRVVVGDDFSFGRGRQADARELQRLGDSAGFTVDVVQKVDVDGIVASSTRIRSFLLQGNVRAATLLLARPYVLEGVVVAGDRRGRTMGYPTLNLSPVSQLVPGRGVYAGFWWFSSSEKGRPAVANIGHRPTFGGTEVRVEVYVLEASLGDCTGKQGRFAPLERLRDEMRFRGTGDLVRQIAEDVERAKQLLKGHTRHRRLPPAYSFEKVRFG